MNPEQTLSTPPLISPAALAERLAGRAKILLMMDYDGTMVPIAPTPDQARPEKKLLGTLARLAQKPEYVLAVLSGRRLEDLLQLLPVPGLYLAGVHGAVVKKPNGSTVPLLKRKDTEKAILALANLARACIGSQQGFLVENKRYALAIHYRLAGAGQAEETLELFLRKSEDLRRQWNLELLQGKKILEVRPQGLHKGSPLLWLKKNFPGHFPVFLGDDTTDEDAFRHNKNGQGVLVSVHPRPSYANLRLKSPSEVQEFLELLAR